MFEGSRQAVEHAGRLAQGVVRHFYGAGLWHGTEHTPPA
jgi:hypothetical protein